MDPSPNQSQPTPDELVEMMTNLDESFITQARNAEGNPITAYPDYYCGEYVNDNTLEIKVTDTNSKEIKNDLIRRAGSDKFFLESGKSSMNELLKVQDIINKADERTV